MHAVDVSIFLGDNNTPKTNTITHTDRQNVIQDLGKYGGFLLRQSLANPTKRIRPETQQHEVPGRMKMAEA
jgi:hypothetical protein